MNLSHVSHDENKQMCNKHCVHCTTEHGQVSYSIVGWVLDDITHLYVAISMKQRHYSYIILH